MVSSVVLANASDALLDGRCFRRTLMVVSELWRGFRTHCKVELAVLLEGFLLKTLRATSPQVRGCVCECVAINYLKDRSVSSEGKRKIIPPKVKCTYHNELLDFGRFYIKIDIKIEVDSLKSYSKVLAVWVFS